MTATTFDTAAARAAIQAQGFALLPAFFDRSLMDQVRAELDRARVVEEARFGAAMLQEIGQDGYVSDVMAFGPAFESVLNAQPFHDLLEALLGDPRLFIAQGIILDPGKGRGIWPRCWHADMFDVTSAIADPTFNVGINCLVMVDDLVPENGPTALLPGSQRLAELRVTTEEELRQMEFRAVAPSGSLLLIEGGTWHSAGLNQTAAPRRVLKLLFTRGWVRPQIDYGAVVRDDVARRLSPRARRLLRLPPLSE